MGIVDKQHGFFCFAIINQCVGTGVLFEFFPGFTLIEGNFLLFFIPPFADGGIVVPFAYRTEGVEEERIRFDFCAPDFAGVFV